MYNKKYYVFNKKGLYKEFTNYYYFLYFVFSKSSSTFGNTLKDKRWYFPPRINHLICPFTPIDFRQVEYVAYDSNMVVISCKILDKLCCTFSNNLYRVYPKNRNKNLAFKDALFRRAPISGLIKKNWRYYNYLRNPKTLQEIKHNIGYKEFTRGKRRNIPTNFDDIVRSDRFIKLSWKKEKKKKQWM